MKTVNILIYIFIPLFVFSLYMALFGTPVMAQHGNTGRILFLHVPAAWTAVIAFVTAGISAALYLKSAQKKYSRAMHRAAILGVVFIIIATVAGSVWAGKEWNSFWNWDVRETSILLLLLVYAAYFALRTFSKGKRTKKVSAAYLVYAAMLMPLFVFVVPRLYHSLHPVTIINREGKVHLDALVRFTLLMSMISATLLFSILMRIKLQKNGTEEGNSRNKSDRK